MRFHSFDGEWSEYNLGEVVEILDNLRKPIKETNRIKMTGEFPYYGASGVIDHINKYIFDGDFVLLSEDGANIIDRSSRVAFEVHGKCWINNHAHVLKTINHNLTFISEYLESKKYDEYNTGTAQPKLNQEVIKTIPIFIPKLLEEEHKIADLLAKINSKIETQNKIICKYESLIKGISEIYFNKEPNKFIRIKDLILFGKAGGTPSSFVSEYYDGNIPFLSIADITKEGKYISSTEKCLSEKGLKNSSAWIVPKDSLILSMYASVGLTCINKVQLSTSQAMFSMVLENYEDVEYLYYYLNYFRLTKIHRLLETGTQSNINADTIKGIKIPFYKNKTIFIKTMLRIEECIENEKRMLAALLKQKTFLLKNMFI